jgi:hypothetical protein
MWLDDLHGWWAEDFKTKMLQWGAKSIQPPLPYNPVDEGPGPRNVLAYFGKIS